MNNSQSKDSLGDRMKSNYENRTRTLLPRRTYTVIRLDGKAFHTYTRGLQRPFDQDLMDDMDNTAKFLCEKIQGCKLAYVQSDEISLVLTDFDDIATDAWFDGNIQKMVSVSASMAAAKFNDLRLMRMFSDSSKTLRDSFLSQDRVIARNLAFFDSRVFTIPDPVEVENYLLWRQQDATRNSIQMAAQSMFSHKELQGVNCDGLQEKMWSEKGVNWNDYPDGFKRGRCVVKTLQPKRGEDFVDVDELVKRLDNLGLNEYLISIFKSTFFNGGSFAPNYDEAMLEWMHGWFDHNKPNMKKSLTEEEIQSEIQSIVALTGRKLYSSSDDLITLSYMNQQNDRSLSDQIEKDDKSGIWRNVWVVEAAPVFTKQRDYIRARLPRY